MENAGDPVTLVRSPMLTKLDSGRTVTASRPLNREIRLDCGGSSVAAALAPPRRSPGYGPVSCRNSRRRCSTSRCRPIRAIAAPATPAFRENRSAAADSAIRHSDGCSHRSARSATSSSINGRISLGPSAQFIPTLSSGTCEMEFQKRFDRLPGKAAIAAGLDKGHGSHDRHLPRSFGRSRCWIAKNAALAFRVSKIVSTSRRSTPPSSRPRTWSL